MQRDTQTDGIAQSEPRASTRSRSPRRIPEVRGSDADVEKEDAEDRVRTSSSDGSGQTMTSQSGKKRRKKRRTSGVVPDFFAEEKPTPPRRKRRCHRKHFEDVLREALFGSVGAISVLQDEPEERGRVPAILSQSSPRGTLANPIPGQTPIIGIPGHTTFTLSALGKLRRQLPEPGDVQLAAGTVGSDV